MPRCINRLSTASQWLHVPSAVFAKLRFLQNSFCAVGTVALISRRAGAYCCMSRVCARHLRLYLTAELERVGNVGEWLLGTTGTGDRDRAVTEHAAEHGLIDTNAFDLG